MKFNREFMKLKVISTAYVLFCSLNQSIIVDVDISEVDTKLSVVSMGP
jgi:hypothetical protein